MSYIKKHLSEARAVLDGFDTASIENIVQILRQTRNDKGRLFILGVGGSAANASHAVNDFRKICGIETYTPTDNVSELTARINDDGWDSVFEEWIKGCQLTDKDCILILSVGGGNLEKNVSPNLVKALVYAKKIGAKITGIVGRDGGYTKTVADACCVVPVVNPENTTPHTEAFQAVIWHAVVSHPDLKIAQTKWESVK